jgi:hypothetical protein
MGAASASSPSHPAAYGSAHGRRPGFSKTTACGKLARFLKAQGKTWK